MGYTAVSLQAQPDAVVHLAAISIVGHAEDTAFYGVNVMGTTSLLAAVAALPVCPRCVLLGSSANIYGNCEALPAADSQPSAPVNHYAMTKLAMEYMAMTCTDRLPMVITRPVNYIWSGKAPQFLIPKLVSHFARQVDRIDLGNLHVEREFNDVRLVCDAYLRLLDRGVPGQPYTLQHVISTSEQITGHHMEVQVKPDFVRANKVHRLCSSPNELLAYTGPLEQPTLEDTLRRMLAEVKV